MRIGCDTGGTFTDIVVAKDSRFDFYKSPTTPARPIDGIMAGLEIAARDRDMALDAFLGGVETFIHGTTHPLNAVLTGKTAPTALIVTLGHRDILTLREGGRADPFDKSEKFPRAYVPRSLTFEIEERVLYDGHIDQELSEAAIDRVARQVVESGVEAVAICLLWSVRNAAHELRLRDELSRRSPSLEISVSAEVNPILREFRRASATCIDASLKGFVRRYMSDLENDLWQAGLRSPVYLVGSDATLMSPEQAIERPIALMNSGPAMAPVAANMLAELDYSAGANSDLIISDTGGTTFDVSVVRRNVVPMTNESFVGGKQLGLFSGYPSVDVQSVGAGGGSIAWVDEGGLLHVGPQSAGADPGPACYGRGGEAATLTDAAVVRGIIDPSRFLGGRIALQPALSEDAIERTVASKLGLDVPTAALRIMTLATESMVRTIEEAVSRHGVESVTAKFVGGGGAAGFNVVRLADMLGCKQVLFPFSSPLLSAFGMTVGHPSAEARRVRPMRSTAFDCAHVDGLFEDLRREAAGKLPPGVGTAEEITYEHYTYARYEGQAWEVEVPLPANPDTYSTLFLALFHKRHEELFSYADPASAIEFLTWRVRAVRAGDRRPTIETKPTAAARHEPDTHREVFVRAGQRHCLPIYRLTPGTIISTMGPAIVETPYSTIFIEDEYRLSSNAAGDLEVHLG